MQIMDRWIINSDDDGWDYRLPDVREFSMLEIARSVIINPEEDNFYISEH